MAILGARRDPVRNVLAILDADTGEILAERDAKWRNHLAWTPDGSTIVGVTDGPGVSDRLVVVSVDDLDDERLVGGELGYHEKDLSLSPDGRQVAVAGGDQRVRIHDVSTGALVCPPLELSRDLFAVAFSPDGSRLAVSGHDQVITIYDTDRYEPLVQLSGHRSYVYELAWSEDGKTLVSASGDNTARIWRSE